MIKGIVLRNYQQEASDLLVASGCGLLALTMGAGKTAVAINAIEELADEGTVSNGLVVCLSSLKYQWQAEIKRFTGQHALVIDGTPAQRARLYEYVPKYRYTILNYETIVNDWTVWRDELDFDFIIADEVSQIKSFSAKRSRKLKFIGKRASVRIALTGQPIENKPEELFSIMEFVDPTVLGDFRKFDRLHIVRGTGGKALRFRALPKVQKKLSTVMYRKTREEIQDQFPDVISNTLPFPLSEREAALYEVAAGYTLAKLIEARGQFGSNFDLATHYGKSSDPISMKLRGDIMSGLLAMRMICDDANLLLHSAHLFDKNEGQGSKLAAEFKAQGLLDDLPDMSSKREVFRSYIADILQVDDRSKVVAFTTFKGLIRSVQHDLERWGSVQFTGDMNARQKQAAKERFQQDPKCRLFLSSDAGGYGVDLPQANHLVSLDLPWSTGAFEQRESRIIRISSEWDHVNLAVTLARGSVEERMYEMIQEKRGVSAAFLDGKYSDDGDYTPTLDTLTNFLQTSSVRA
jgi:SNF2 family DNA or RNA helicase